MTTETEATKVTPAEAKEETVEAKKSALEELSENDDADIILAPE